MKEENVRNENLIRWAVLYTNIKNNTISWDSTLQFA